MDISFLDCPEITDKLNKEERKVYYDVLDLFKFNNTVITKTMNIAFAIILLYACFALLPVWVAASLIGIKLAIPAVKFINMVHAVKKLKDKCKDFDRILASIRYKISKLN